MFQKVLIAALAIVAFGLNQEVSWAHKPLLSVSDNNDGTVSIETGFSDGSSAAGHKIIVKNRETGQTLLETRVGEDGSLEIKKPSEEFTVSLDAGEGHVVTQVGPAPSKESQTPTKDADQSTSKSDKPTGSAPQSMNSTNLHVVGQIPHQYPMGLVAGTNMAFEMLAMAMFVTAIASVALLALATYFVGHRMGVRSVNNNSLGKEAQGCSWCQGS